MANLINQLQVRRATFDSAKMIDRNHWTKNLALKPHIFEAPTRKLFASKTNNLNFSSGNFLESLFGLGSTKYIDDIEWSWKMRTQAYRPITILENRTTINPDTPGKYRQPIKVLVDVDLAALGETWSPGVSDKSQVVTVVEKVKEARGFLYTLKTYTETEEHFINKKHLEPGVEWTRMFAMRGEAAESGSYFEKGTDIVYKNNLVKLRKEFKVTDFAAQSVLDIAFCGDDGKIHKSWMDWQEIECHNQMNKELALNALYSRLGDAPLIDPDSGYPIAAPCGMEQQISFGGQNERYTQLSVEQVEAFFNKLVYSRISPGDLGEVIGWSGHYGMIEFSKIMKKWLGDQAINLEASTFIASDPKGVNINSLRVGHQYTVFNLPNGGSFRLMHNPFNDDRSQHREVDPLTGIPLQSQRITILDVTGGNGQSINTKDNIKLVRKNKVYGVTHIEGRVGVGGVPTGDRAKHSGDYYEVHISDSIGIEITDPTVTGELIKTVN